MAILKPNKTRVVNGVTVNEHFLSNMYPGAMSGSVIGVTIHNTDWISTAAETTAAEQYTRATKNGNMGDVIVHYYVDNTCAWQNLPHNIHGWHAADGTGNGNMRTIAIECIMDGSGSPMSTKSEDNAARLAAGILKELGFGIDQLYTHQHWYSKKYCPAYILPHWETFRRKVQSYLGESSTVSELYRIRKSWGDVASQIGAYSTLEAAKKAWKDGYKIYNSKGEQAFPDVSVASEAPVEIKTFNREIRQLRKGMSGDDVKSLQQLLYAKGYAVGSDDGIFGAKTEKSVLNFQSDKGLSKDGVVGNDTFKKLWGY